MRIRPSRRPAPYLNGADQRRMLALVGTLALVLVAAGWAADPANWYWIAPPRAAPAAATGDAGEGVPDFSVRDAAPPRPGTIRVAMTVPETSEPAMGEPGKNGDGRLPAALTAAAEDRTIGLTRAERDAVDVILAGFGASPPAPAADAETVSFPALMRDPDYYRGRPLRVFGEARGITDLPNDRGVELWVFPPDSGNSPVRVVANRADGLPRGGLLKEGVPVTVDGAFFKLQGYAARDKGGGEKLHVAPLVLADAAGRARLEAAVPQTPAALPWVVLGVIAAALAAGALLVWRWKRDDRDFERRTLSRLSAAADGEGEPLTLASADDADPAAFLAGLSDPRPPAPPAASPSEPATP